ncbi:MAG: PAS domain-containing protein [Caulobacterales bacterium]|jgi:hypothetical protein
MIGEDSCCGATRAMLAYARAMMRGEDTPRLGKDGLGAADRLFVTNRRADDGLDVMGDGLDLLFAAPDRTADFGRLFSPPERRLILALLDAVAMAGEPGVIRAHGLSRDSARVEVELMLSPLPAFWSRGDRFLGHAVAITPSAPAIATRLTINTMLTPASSTPLRPRPALRLVVSNS